MKFEEQAFANYLGAEVEWFSDAIPSDKMLEYYHGQLAKGDSPKTAFTYVTDRFAKKGQRMDIISAGIQEELEKKCSAYPTIEQNPVVRMNTNVARRNELIQKMSLDGVDENTNEALRQMAFGRVPPALRIDTTKKLNTSFGSGKNTMTTLALEIS